MRSLLNTEAFPEYEALFYALSTHGAFTSTAEVTGEEVKRQRIKLDLGKEKSSSKQNVQWTKCISLTSL